MVHLPSSEELIRLKVRVVAQPGSVLAWGARGRWFESSPPDNTKGELRGSPFFIPLTYPYGRNTGNSPAWRELLFKVRVVAQPGSALRSGRRGRWFESSLPDLKAL